MNIKKLSLLSMLLALALIFGYVEALIPIYLGVPGAKLGLPNAVMLIVLYLYGPREAFIINITRILLNGFLFTNLFSICYSLAGGLLSLFIMFLLVKYTDFSITAVSALGGTVHNIGQFIMAVFVLNTFSIIGYLPFLIITGCIMGTLLGFVASLIIPTVSQLPKNGGNP